MAFESFPSNRLPAPLASAVNHFLQIDRLEELYARARSQSGFVRRLLEDLELVLVQLVEFTPDSSGSERQMIDSTLAHGHVLSRIRYAVPAGATGI